MNVIGNMAPGAYRRVLDNRLPNISEPNKDMIADGYRIHYSEPYEALLDKLVEGMEEAVRHSGSDLDILDTEDFLRLSDDMGEEWSEITEQTHKKLEILFDDWQVYYKILVGVATRHELS